MVRNTALGLAVLAGFVVANSGCLIVSKGSDGGSAGDTGTAGSGATGEGGTGAGMVTQPPAGGSGPTNCDQDPNDDECTACVKSSCCAEIEACANDASCADVYAAYAECIWPAADAEPSGYSTGFCKAEVGATGTPAGALIDCYKSQCGTDKNPVCGVEEVITWEGFAAGFLEEFCSGCHFDGYEQTGLGPTDENGNPKPVANYSCDWEWLDGPWSQGPTDEHPNGGFANPDWFSLMSYQNVLPDGELIRCGVQGTLPGGCDAQKFPNPKRFPPSGNAPGGAHCWWMPDGSTCAQPTDQARAKMVSWIVDGMVCNQGCDTTCATP
ncbi:MAG: hypothetical protein IPK82_18355 [Polyangiaceae bacterium]|nr:hypothetical protein [Polyangiaceae bacterium]